LTPEAVLDLGRQAIWVMLEVGAPSLLTALSVGVLISLLQALTQIQESTLSFLPKLVAILGVLALTLPFALTVLGDFTRGLCGRIAAMGAGS
jgi:flagellar biosynthetic protein FliQ